MPTEELYSDEELLASLSNDNERAFTILYERYWEMLFALAYNRLKEVQTAEDTVHDVFMSLWHNRHTLQPEVLKNYLAAAVKYTVLARIKKENLARRYQTETSCTPLSQVTPESAAHYRLILKLMRQEVNNLPEKCQLIFKYSREQGMSSKEIAGLLHLSSKTVDNQLHKALHLLKLKLKRIVYLLFF